MANHLDPTQVTVVDDGSGGLIIHVPASAIILDSTPPPPPPPSKTIVANNPGTQTHGVAFHMTGTITGYTSVPALDFTYDAPGGAQSWQPIPSGVTANGWDFVVTNNVVGLHNFTVRDHSGSPVSPLIQYNVV